jgi:glycosyltransferase involved in cell wall biosynthesis
MTRILFLTERHAPDLGGVSASATRIARSLTGLGAQVDVVAWTRSLQAGQVVCEAGNPAVYRIGRFREWDTTMPHTLNLLDWLLSTAPYQLVWGHYLSLAGFLAVWFGRLNGVPSVVSIRGNDLDRDVFPPGDFARLQWTLGHATAITAVTLDLARKAQSLSGRNGVVHLRNVVDTGQFFPSPEAGAEVRTRLGIGADEAVLGFCGELREKKGLAHLMEALVAVRRVRPARLLLIGEVRPSERPRLLQWIGPGGIEERDVLITGQLLTPESVNAHLQACDVYLQPSLWDGMPNALLEAMAAGCGSIASDAGGIPEIITPGVDGIVLPRWQLHRLGEAALEWLDADPEHRERVRRAARARMVTYFSPEVERQALQSLLAGLIPSSAQTAESAAPDRSQV